MCVRVRGVCVCVCAVKRETKRRLLTFFFLGGKGGPDPVFRHAHSPTSPSPSPFSSSACRLCQRCAAGAQTSRSRLEPLPGHRHVAGNPMFGGPFLRAPRSFPGFPHPNKLSFEEWTPFLGGPFSGFSTSFPRVPAPHVFFGLPSAPNFEPNFGPSRLRAERGPRQWSTTRRARPQGPGRTCGPTNPRGHRIFFPFPGWFSLGVASCYLQTNGFKPYQPPHPETFPWGNQIPPVKRRLGSYFTSIYTSTWVPVGLKEDMNKSPARLEVRESTKIAAPMFSESWFDKTTVGGSRNQMPETQCRLRRTLGQTTGGRRVFHVFVSLKKGGVRSVSWQPQQGYSQKNMPTLSQGASCQRAKIEASKSVKFGHRECNASSPSSSPSQHSICGRVPGRSIRDPLCQVPCWWEVG